MSRYLNHILWIIACVVTSTLMACKSEVLKEDPIRTEFVDACMGRVEYKSMKPKKRAARCECSYDKTMNKLLDEEKRFAQFYLLAQVGVDIQSSNLVQQPDMKSMLKASKAIGIAVKQCK